MIVKIDNLEFIFDKITIYHDEYAMAYYKNTCLELSKHFEILSPCRVYVFPYNSTVDILSVE